MYLLLFSIITTIIFNPLKTLLFIIFFLFSIKIFNNKVLGGNESIDKITDDIIDDSIGVLTEEGTNIITDKMDDI